MWARVNRTKSSGKRSNSFNASKNVPHIFGVQAKLQVGQPNDKYEKEADQVADTVLNRSANENQPFFAPTSFPTLQKQSDNPMQMNPVMEKEGMVQMQPVEEEEELIQPQPMEEEEELLQPKLETGVRMQEEEEAIQMQPVEEEEELIQPQPMEEEEELLQPKLETGVRMQEEEEAIQMQPVEEEEEMVQTQPLEEEEEELVQPMMETGATMDDEMTKPTGNNIPADPTIESRLNSDSKNGYKLDPTTMSEMEQGFGVDFSNVNIHTDAQAIQMSKELGAQAFTHGNDIYFNKGKYNPQSREGKHLLAHELTHTIQQTGKIPTNVQMTIGDNRDLNSARFSGNLLLEACLDNEQTLRVGSSGAAVSLIQQALIDAGFLLPQYGVDGIFGNETRNALQDFQRASSLSVDGVVGPATMSALDGLFSGGAPALPPAIPVVPTPTTPPTVTSETLRPAPDGSADTRTTVGVGERVRFTANTSGTWSVSDGHIIGLNTGSNIVWEAPPVATNPTITVTTPGGTRVIPFTVIAPNNLSMTVNVNDAIPAGTAGACMITDVIVEPFNVSFGRTQWLEVPGPATNVSGYFNRFAAGTIFHHPNPNYLPFDDNNSGLNDHASWHAVPAPFSLGTFEWVIPNRYKIDGESDAQGRLFTNTVQAFTMFPGGTMMITKAGAWVIRFINNTIFNG